MMYLLVTPMLLLLVSYFIEDKDVVLASRLFALICLVDLVVWSYLLTDFYYIRSAIVDLLLFLLTFILRNHLVAFGVGVCCCISFVLNIYEQMSYYQTIFYAYREYIQFVLVQMSIFFLLVDCKWRKLWKTDSQN